MIFRFRLIGQHANDAAKLADRAALCAHLRGTTDKWPKKREFKDEHVSITPSVAGDKNERFAVYIKAYGLVGFTDGVVPT